MIINNRLINFPLCIVNATGDMNKHKLVKILVERVESNLLVSQPQFSQFLGKYQQVMVQKVL